MRLVLVALALAAVVSRASAQDQGGASLQSMYFANGTCQRLVTPEGDQSASCNKALGIVSYSNGRHSFWFSIPHKSLISFSGSEESTVGNIATLKLDLLTMGSDPKAIHAVGGTGSCTFTDPWKGVAHIRCQGSSADGQFAAEFTTDGQPPQGSGAP